MQPESVTRGIRVNVDPQYHPERSNPARSTWFFSYTVTITNEGTETVQLVSRHWVVTDAEGHVENIRGPGVVGEQPTLQPGGQFRYTSFCPLPTSLGSMHGSYQMVTQSGERFDATIPPFALVEPTTEN